MFSKLSTIGILVVFLVAFSSYSATNNKGYGVVMARPVSGPEQDDNQGLRHRKKTQNKPHPLVCAGIGALALFGGCQRATIDTTTASSSDAVTAYGASYLRHHHNFPQMEQGHLIPNTPSAGDDVHHENRRPTVVGTTVDTRHLDRKLLQQDVHALDHTAKKDPTTVNPLSTFESTEPNFYVTPESMTMSRDAQILLTKNFGYNLDKKGVPKDGPCYKISSNCGSSASYCRCGSNCKNVKVRGINKENNKYIEYIYFKCCGIERVSESQKQTCLFC